MFAHGNAAVDCRQCDSLPLTPHHRALACVACCLLQVLEDDETLEELCLSWHMQQRQHSQWMPVELQRHK